MKTFTLPLALLSIFLFSSFSASLKEEETILNLALEMEKIDELLLESPANKDEGVVIVTNNEVSANLKLYKFGQAVQLVESRQDLAEDRPYLAIESFKVKGDNAVLKFTYAGYSVKTKFKLEDGKWISRSFRLNGNGRYMIENDF